MAEIRDVRFSTDLGASMISIMVYGFERAGAADSQFPEIVNWGTAHISIEQAIKLRDDLNIALAEAAKGKQS